MNRLILITCLAAGCVQGSQPSDGAVNGKPSEGIYLVDVSPAMGDCQPPTVNGPLSQAAQVYGGIDFTGALRVVTPYASPPAAATTFQSSDITGGHWTADGLEMCGATLDSSITVTGSSDTAYSVERSDTWSNTRNADRSVECVPAVPAGDCHTTASLRFTLVQACPSPSCVVRDSSTPSGAGPTLSCVCG